MHSLDRAARALLVASLAAPVATPVAAATFNVAAGDTAGLIAAMQTARTNGDQSNTIVLATCVYTLTVPHNSTYGPTGLPVISSSKFLTINGNGAVIERSTAAGTPDFRFFAYDTQTTTLTLNDLTLRNGSAGPGEDGGAILGVDTTDVPSVLNLNRCSLVDNLAGGFGGALAVTRSTASLVRTEVSRNTAGQNGGGILSSLIGRLTLTECTVADNLAMGTAGGGIFVASNGFGSEVSAHIERSAILRNRVTGMGSVGGGIFHSCFVRPSDRTIEIVDSTIHGNQAEGFGGGIYNLATDACCGGGTALSVMQVTGSTITGNTAGVAGGGIAEKVEAANAVNQVFLRSTIVAGNAAPAGPDLNVLSGTLTSLSHNLVGNNATVAGTFPAGTPNATPDWAGTPVAPLDPLLGALGQNGGRTETRAVLAGSLALGNADPAGASPADQRMQPRVGSPEIGAFEVKSPAPPTITCPAARTIDCACGRGSDLTGTATAGPACTGLVLSVSEASAQACSITRTFTATDSCGTASCTQAITIVDPAPPVLSGVPPSVTVSCAAPVPAPPVVTATDCDPNVLPNFQQTSTPGSCPDNRTITRTWTATDACGNTTTGTQQIVIRDTGAPTLQGVPASVTVACNAIPPLPTTVTASDDCDPAPQVTLTSTTTPGSCPDSYTLTRSWTATDRCGNATSASQIITVRDTTPPLLANLPADVTVECDAVPPPPAGVTASDNCDPAPLVTLVTTTTPGTCADSYTLTRTWTATDRCGNVATASRTVTVRDTTAPDVAAVLTPTAPRPAAPPSSVCSPPHVRTLTVDCGALVDNCDPAPATSAVLHVVNHEVPAAGGPCVEVAVDAPVACGEVVTLELTRRPCPRHPQRAPDVPAGVGSDGFRIFRGTSIELRVTATDRCGNQATGAYDPAAEPSPLCDERTTTGECCPAIGRPEDGRCPLAPCGAP